jgi:hypothetical protein
MIFTKKKIKLSFETINLYQFKVCYNGDLTLLDNDFELWDNIRGEYEKKTKKGQDVVLELQKQVAIKESEIIILDTCLFIIREAFKAYMNSQDDFYIDQIIDAADNLKRYGIKFNKDNDIIKEHNKCVKQVKNKRNNIKQDLAQLQESTKGSMSFDDLISIVGKYSGGGIINQKSTMLYEFCSMYNLMTNGK